jgi:hypothetical protein
MAVGMLLGLRRIALERLLMMLQKLDSTPDQAPKNTLNLGEKQEEKLPDFWSSVKTHVYGRYIECAVKCVPHNGEGEGFEYGVIDRYVGGFVKEELEGYSGD